MRVKQRKKIFLFGLLVCCSTFFNAICVMASEKEEEGIVQNPKQEGGATISGKLSWSKMSGLADNDWEELVLTDSEKNSTILIGKLVEQLLDILDKQVTVTGLYKPPMRMKGKTTSVLEVQSIDAIEQ